MTKQLLLLLALLAIAPALLAQDTLNRPRTRYEVGLNITNTLTSFVGNGSNATQSDPYLITLRVGGALKRARLGVNFQINAKSDVSNVTGGSTDTKEHLFNFRAGYEQVLPVSKKAAFYWGFDGIISFSYEKIKTNIDFGGNTSLLNRVYGIGTGPVLGMQFRLHPRVYAVYKSGTKEINAFPDIRKEKIKDLVWQPLAPTSLYINFVF
jgi:hypothetical protein